MVPPAVSAGGLSASVIMGYRNDLMKIARLQLRGDDGLAADVVQETLIAAIQGAAEFRGASSPKTWLIGILKYKILDVLRSRTRQPLSISELGPELDTSDLDALFDHQGVWQNVPREWSDPAHSAQQLDFLQMLEFCLTELPANTGRAFMLRELFELDTAEICELLSVTPNHLGVLLYRARMTLRACLEEHWLDRPGAVS